MTSDTFVIFNLQMASTFYKYCVVPKCKSTTVMTPNKLFVRVPTKKQIRRKWLKLARRDDAHSLSLDSRMYFCEDHFDLPNDMLNYMEYHIMGKVSQMRMKPGCIPTKFECQEDRRKRTSSSAGCSYILKKQRMMTIGECLKEYDESLTLSSSICQVQDTPNIIFNLAEENVQQILPNDTEKYMEYHVMGTVSQVHMKLGCMPKKFICQPDKTTRTSDTTEQPYIDKKQRIMTLQECVRHFEVKSIVTEQSSSEEIASSSSVQQNVEKIPQLAPKVFQKSIQINKNYVGTSRYNSPHKPKISRYLKKTSQSTTKKIELAQYETNLLPNNHLKVFTCQVCEKIFLEEVKFFEHFESDCETGGGELLTSLPLEEEKYEVIPLIKLEPESESLDANLKNLNCIECNIMFETQQKFETHMRDVHTKIEVVEECIKTEHIMDGIPVDANKAIKEEIDSKEWYHTEEIDSKAWCHTEVVDLKALCHTEEVDSQAWCHKEEEDSKAWYHTEVVDSKAQCHMEEEDSKSWYHTGETPKAVEDGNDHLQSTFFT